MKRYVVIGGAQIGNYDVIRKYLGPQDYYVFCDCGLKHRESLGVEPDLVTGDFDSWNMPCAQDTFVISEEAALAEHLKHDKGSLTDGPEARDLDPDRSSAGMIVLPHKKDDTDTVFAVKEGIRRGFEEFLFLGVTGQRLDHTLANVYALLMLEEQGKRAMIVDDYSEMEIVGKEPAIIDCSFSYFSLISLAGTARHVCIENAVFPLSDGQIFSDYQYAVSNEVLPGRNARVSVGEGKLLLIRVR